MFSHRARPYFYKRYDYSYWGIGLGLSRGYRMAAIYADVGPWTFEVGIRR